jgi:hypothetical protein
MAESMEHLAKPSIKDWTHKATPAHDKFEEPNRRLQLTFELDGGDSMMKDKPAAMSDYITPPVQT